jgi:chaperone required for assembly of F1-ATPase
MRDIFEELNANQPLDPMEAARRGARPSLRARFYKQAAIGEQNASGFPVLLDNRPVRTPAKGELAGPSRGLALAIAAEWDAQRDKVDPARMPLTRLANSIIDGVVTNPGPVAAEVRKYLGSDLVLYRASEPDGLVANQINHWNPVVDWARDELGARFVLAEGFTFVAQPPEAIAAAAGAIPTDAWRLGAVNSVTSLTGSALIALALAYGKLDAATAWAAAHVDEDWNMQTWGRDEQALARRDFRYAEMQAAAQVLAMLREAD